MADELFEYLAFYDLRKLQLVLVSGWLILLSCAPVEALSDSQARLSSSVPSLNSRMSQHLSERCCRFLKSAAEVPRLYRRTNKVRPGCSLPDAPAAA